MSDGKRPPKYKGDHKAKGCAVTALAMLGGVVGVVAAASYGVVHIFA